jgi:hypothetical protein
MPNIARRLELKCTKLEKPASYAASVKLAFASSAHATIAIEPGSAVDFALTPTGEVVLLGSGDQ